jgi:type VI secretion system protein ImpH
MDAVSLPLSAKVDQLLSSWMGEPWRADYFALLRRLESVAISKPRLGLAKLPADEIFRVGQEPSMTFAPASFSRFIPATDVSPPMLRQRFFGYLGPNGPLPTHLTEFVQLRYLNHNDPTWLGFLDTLSHRFSLHLYRAWAQSKPTVSFDRPGQSRFRFQIGSLVGLGTSTRLQRDPVLDDAKLFFTGLLSQQVRNVERIEKILASYFAVPVKVEQWASGWLKVPKDQCSRLGMAFGMQARLGERALLGEQVWDRQHRISIHIGPLTQEQFRRLLPNGNSVDSLRSWMKELLGQELAWNARLILKASAVPVTKTGLSQLGWDSWLGSQPRMRDAVDVEISEGNSFS